MGDLPGLAARYRDFAAATAGQSACFERWARNVAGDHEVLAWLADLPEPKRQPNLVFAAARWHGVAAPGPYEGLRAALLADDGAIRGTILTRSTQTNEVGRLATLAPAFARLTDRPLALVEVGASAGLCLYPDRYDYDWSPRGRLTGSGGPTLRCEVAGPMPVPGRPVEVAWRCGIDLHPLDVTDEDATAWLTTLVWPEQAERRDRLRAAVELTREDPPRLVTGDLVDLLPAQVERAAAYGEVVVFHSAVVVYLSEADRRGFWAMMTDLLAAGACRWVSNEDAGVLPDLTRTASEPAPTGLDYVLGVDGRAVAWTHQHGAAMTWLRDPVSGAGRSPRAAPRS